MGNYVWVVTTCGDFYPARITTRYSGESTAYHRLHILHGIEILKQDATRNILQHGLQFIDLKYFLHVGYNICLVKLLFHDTFQF